MYSAPVHITLKKFPLVEELPAHQWDCNVLNDYDVGCKNTPNYCTYGVQVLTRVEQD